MEIADNGTISHAVIDYVRFDPSRAYEPDIIHISGRVYAIVCRGPGGWPYDDGYLVTLRIGNNGDLSGIDDKLTFSTDSYDPNIIHLNDNAYAIFYRERYGDAYVKTIEINLKETVGRILSKDKAYGISANSTRVFATINTHSQIISAPISPGFNHVVFAYNKDNSSEQLRLYINGTKMANGTLTEVIATNANKLYIGGVNAIIDEVVIYGMDLSQADVTDRYVTLTS